MTAENLRSDSAGKINTAWSCKTLKQEKKTRDRGTDMTVHEDTVTIIYRSLNGSRKLFKFSPMSLPRDEMHACFCA